MKDFKEIQIFYLRLYLVMNDQRYSQKKNQKSHVNRIRFSNLLEEDDYQIVWNFDVVYQ
jgi:hypothetical protein